MLDPAADHRSGQQDRDHQPPCPHRQGRAASGHDRRGEERRRRLVARAQDEAEVIERRLSRSKGEIAKRREYDYVIINDDFDRAYAELAHIYHAERLKRLRNPGLEPLVDQLLAEEI